MASIFNPREGKCESCGKMRSLSDGYCAECEQEERDRMLCVQCHQLHGTCQCADGPYYYGGRKL